MQVWPLASLEQRELTGNSTLGAGSQSGETLSQLNRGGSSAEIFPIVCPSRSKK